MNNKMLLLPFLITLVGCQNSVQESTIFESTYSSQIASHDYIEIIDKTIKWRDLFNINQLHYYAYIYSLTCGHCQNIKDLVIDKALQIDYFYFIEFNKEEIPIIQDASTSLYKNDVDEMGILGTPSLIEIYNKTSIYNVAGEKEITKIVANLE